MDRVKFGNVMNNLYEKVPILEPFPSNGITQVPIK